jgi:hypothetical protein
MTIQHADRQADSQFASLVNHVNQVNQEMQAMAQALGLDHQAADAELDLDPVEAYFECITTCSLDDGECITTCTELLREQV